MPRVLQIINRLNLGGPTFIAGYLTAYLGSDYESLLISGMKDDSEESSDFIVQNMGVKPVYIKDMRREISFSADKSAYLEIDKIIKEFKPDIIHTHAAKAGTLGRIAAIRNKVPVSLHTFHGHVFHGYFSPLKTKVFLEIERFLANKTSGIIAISEEQKRELVDVYKITTENKAFVIPLGIDLGRFETNMAEKRNAFRKEYNIDDETITVGIVGRLVPIKNHQLFIQTWKKIQAITTKKIHAFIIGDGEDRLKLENLCKDIGLNFNTPEQKTDHANLTFTSWIIDIDKAVAGLDIMALTSINEGTPVSLIEAQAAGIPIVSTKVGGIKDIVIEGETALLSNLNDTEEFEKNLLLLIENETLRDKMKELGPSFAFANFGYQRLINDTKNLYERLLNK